MKEIGKSAFKRFLLTLALAVGVSWVGSVSLAVAAEDDDVLLDCNQKLNEESNYLECEFRLIEPAQPEKLTLSINDDVVEKPSFTPFISGEKRSAWLYLIDRSNPRRKATVARNVEIVRSQLRNASLRRLIGVATFASDLEVVLEPSAAHDNPDARLDAIKADGLATEYFANALAAIDILKKTAADRKALVIMSDGKAEDTAYQREDVIKAAKEAGVTIIGIGFAEKETDAPYLQKVRRLAEETNGQFASVVGSESISSKFLSNLTRGLENGGTLKAALTPEQSGLVELKLLVKTDSGTLVSGTQSLELAKIEPVVEEEVEPEPKELSTIGQIYSMLSEGMGVWADENPVPAWLILLLIPILLIGAIVMISRGSKTPEMTIEETQPTSADEPVTSMIPSDDILPTLQEEEEEDQEITRVMPQSAETQDLGYFEVVGNESTRYDIPLAATSIGRHSDNDIVLGNDSVHRQHAHFFIKPDGEATIKDLDTANGVYVNGERVSTAILNSGDMIELGEVRLRYVANH